VLRYSRFFASDMPRPAVYRSATVTMPLFAAILHDLRLFLARVTAA
tara:strand:+ start:3191 stop:3328 length:138 start_codon:yes stop_codon:yes gene_type:complete